MRIDDVPGPEPIEYEDFKLPDGRYFSALEYEEQRAIMDAAIQVFSRLQRWWQDYVEPQLERLGLL